MSEWIEHDGSACPVGPHTKVQVRYRDGDVDEPYVAAHYCGSDGLNDWWQHQEAGCHIIAYRIVEEEA